jgi:hypothetical protein
MGRTNSREHCSEPRYNRATQWASLSFADKTAYLWFINMCKSPKRTVKNLVVVYPISLRDISGTA